MARAYVGLGSNVGEPAVQIESAFQALKLLAFNGSFRRSSVYLSAPISSIPQPDYLNAVAGLDTTLDPEALLKALREIESRQGRERKERNAARTLDLDLLLYGAAQWHSATLTLPHPRMMQRRFVLVPLQEIAPGLEIPGGGRIEDILARCPEQRLEVWVC